MSQDMVWYQLYDEIKDNECPICKLLDRVANDFIDAFLYENVNDPKLREELRRSKGFCNAHAWLLQSYGDPLAHAIIYGALLKDAANEFKNRTLITAKKSAGFYHHPDEREKCILCELEDRFCQSYLKIIDENICTNRDFKERFTESGILCVPHMRQFIAVSKNRISLETVQEIVVSKYDSILKCLSEICRKNDYRYSDEPWTADEKDAWTKAVRIMAGRKISKK